MTPDLILVNARVRTMDAAHPRAGGVAVRGGRIVAVGESAGIAALAGPRTARIDAGGRTVLPAFQDAHVHLLDGGLDLVASAALWPVRSVAELLETLAAHARAWPGQMVAGAGWQPGLFGEHNLSAALLDRAVGDRPCMIHDSSYHSACLNSAALALAGIGADTADPETGRIVRDGAGRPTGMLHESAVAMARARLPELGEEDWIAGLRAGLRHANRHGITGIIDPAVTGRHARVYAALDEREGLTLRVAGAAHVTPDERPGEAVERLAALRAAHPGPGFRVNAAKYFLDGVLENRTAAMLAPYADPPGGNAPTMWAQPEIDAHFAAMDAARFQIHVHAIGDAAARAALDGLSAARAANGGWPALHQLAHLQVVDPADLPRIGDLGAMANIQPLWARHDPIVPDDWIGMIGPERLPGTYAFRSMIAAGAPFCLSSDFPVSTLNPFEIIETAVTRRPRACEGAREAFLPGECLSVEEAVAGYTVHAARALWRGEDSGRIAPGCSADMIVLDGDPWDCAPGAIGDIRVLTTVFRGRTVWCDGDFEGGCTP